MQVLQKLQGLGAAKQVFASLGGEGAHLAATATRAVHLPQDLFASWVASVAPVLDLRHVRWSHTQWVRLAVCLAQADPRAVSTLHVSGAAAGHAAVPPEQVEQVQQLLMFCAGEREESEAVCCSCEETCSGIATLVTVGARCEAYKCTSFAPTIGTCLCHTCSEYFLLML